MLTKEYRIPLPMTVEEYRIAQLYMIAKKSREESEVSLPLPMVQMPQMFKAWVVKKCNPSSKLP